MDRSDETLCYSLEEVRERINAALTEAEHDNNVSISVKRLGGYRLLAVSTAEDEPTSP